LATAKNNCLKLHYQYHTFAGYVISKLKLALYYILFLILLLSGNTCKAQDNEFIVGAALGFYGVHITGDIAEMYSSTNGDISGTGGLSFGLNVKHDFSKSIYGAFEIRYSQKGSIYRFTTSYGTNAFERIYLNYIEVPVLIGFKIELKKKYLLAETGFAYARLVSSKMDVSDLNQWDYSDKMDGFKQNDYSWIASIKYPLIKSNKLLAGFRFSYFLASIHSYYNLRNLDYGVELYYLFN
jgi:hypothetical protein